MAPEKKNTPEQRKAVALSYRPQKDQAPKVTAKGRGRLAEKIISLALEHGIPIKEDPDLVEVLAGLDLDQEIPPEVYMVVAEILAFVYQSNEDWRLRNRLSGG